MLFAIENPKLTTESDEYLLDAIQERNHESFAKLVNRHSQKFYRVAYRFVCDKNEAEDIVQEAFLKLWSKPESWNPQKKVKFTTWFHRIIINLCIDQNRKRKPTALPEEILKFKGYETNQDEILDLKQQQQLLDYFIRQLPQRQQIALNLCFYEGMSNKEAANIVGVKLKALQSLIMRAKTTLKTRVREYNLKGVASNES